MKNEELTQRGYIIRWHGGMKDVQLCPDPYAERLYANECALPREVPSTAWAPPVTYVGTRQKVLDSVPLAPRWANSWTIAQRAGEPIEVVSSELYKLSCRNQVKRRRDEGRWVYQREGGL